MTNSIVEMKLSASVLRDYAERVRAQWDPELCPWVGAIDDEAARIEHFVKANSALADLQQVEDLKQALANIPPQFDRKGPREIWIDGYMAGQHALMATMD